MSGFAQHLSDAKDRPPVVSLLTDFGLVDGFVGVMKGVILSLAPRTTIIDITHDLPPQGIRAGAFLLRWAYGYFPAGTIHVAVVDPGVGTRRPILALEASGHRFIAPDNGLLYPLWEEFVKLQEPCRIVEVTNDSLWMDRVSATFHGRDIFSPVAAHLALGTTLDDLGPEIAKPGIEFSLPRIAESENSLQGEILYIDRFGNLITNLNRICVHTWLEKLRAEISSLSLMYKGKRILPVGGSYGNVEPGGLLAPFDGFDMIEIAVNQGSAQKTFDAQIGDPVCLELQ